MRVLSRLIFLIISISYISYINSALRFVFKAVTDGSKSPYTDIEGKDIFDEEWNAQGVLTPVGFRQLYLLGTKDRQRYEEFLSESYNSREVYIRAASSNNTLMSANAYLQGLFPPGTGPNLLPFQKSSAIPPILPEFGDVDILNIGLPALPHNTQIFPVKTFDRLERKYFFFNFNNCGSIHSKFNKNEKLPKVKDWLKQFKLDYGEKLQKVMFANDINEFLDYEYVRNIINTFVSDYIDGKVLKKFTDQGIDLNAFNTTAYEFLNIDMYDVKNGFQTDAFLPNATMSGFKDELTMWLNNRVEGDKKLTGYVSYRRPKIVVFSVPNHVIGGIMAYLGRDKGFDLLPVNFASSIVFELVLKDGIQVSSSVVNKDYSVNIVYDGKLLKTFSFDEFVSLLDSAPNELEIRKECSNHLIDRYGWKNACIAMGVITGVLLILFILLLILCCKDRNKDVYVEDIDHKNEGNNIIQKDKNNQKEMVKSSQQEEIVQNNEPEKEKEVKEEKPMEVKEEEPIKEKGENLIEVKEENDHHDDNYDDSEFEIMQENVNINVNQEINENQENNENIELKN
jgi:hypothetical protein